MILVDTSVWIDHLRSNNARLADLLRRGQVMAHPFVIGELACGNLHHRDEIIERLNELPASPVVSVGEALYFMEHHQLTGLGIGYIDIHLLATTAIASNTALWTRDKKLMKVACQLKLAFKNNH